MNLFDFLNTRFSTNFSDQSQIPVDFKGQTFKKNFVITDYGQVERKLCFINSGIVELTMCTTGRKRSLIFSFQVALYVPILRQTRRFAEVIQREA